MTPDEQKELEQRELIDLYADDALPEALRAGVEAYLERRPDAAREADALRILAARLRAAPAERPDAWFAERALDRLLREHSEAEKSPASGLGGRGANT